MVRHNFTYLAQASHHQAESVDVLLKLPEECLRRIGIEFLAWSPCCFVQLVGLRPHQPRCSFVFRPIRGQDHPRLSL